MKSSNPLPNSASKQAAIAVVAVLANARANLHRASTSAARAMTSRLRSNAIGGRFVAVAVGGSGVRVRVGVGGIAVLVRVAVGAPAFDVAVGVLVGVGVPAGGVPLVDWLPGVGAKSIPVAAASPWENGYIESFHSRLRDEFLEQAQQSMGRFIEDDSACFPGQGLQPLTPPTAFHW